MFRVAGAPVWPCEEAGRGAPGEVEPDAELDAAPDPELDAAPVEVCGREVDRDSYEDREDDAAPMRRPSPCDACAELFRNRDSTKPAAIAPPKNMRGLRRA